MASRTHARAAEPGPFRVDQLREGDRYELSGGHAIYCAPAGKRHARTNLLGGAVLESDPAVANAGVDVGIQLGDATLRAPDVAIGNVPDAPGWATAAPPLAVEYADEHQDEADLGRKIAELLAAGTRYVWVVRLAGARRVEVHESGRARRVARPGEALRAPGVLANPVRVEALYEPAAAHEATLRNLLQRAGYESLDAVREQGHEQGVLAQARRTLRLVLASRDLAVTDAQAARIEACADVATLERWIAAAATATEARAALLAKRPAAGRARR